MISSLAPRGLHQCPALGGDWMHVEYMNTWICERNQRGTKQVEGIFHKCKAGKRYHVHFCVYESCFFLMQILKPRALLNLFLSLELNNFVLCTLGFE